MIKPNTLCMIRGVPESSRGSDNNGKIVVAVKPEIVLGYEAWHTTPVLYSRDGVFRGALAKFLHPLDNPPEDAVDTHSTRLETA